MEAERLRQEEEERLRREMEEEEARAEAERLHQVSVTRTAVYVSTLIWEEWQYDGTASRELHCHV